MKTGGNFLDDYQNQALSLCFKVPLQKHIDRDLREQAELYPGFLAKIHL